MNRKLLKFVAAGLAVVLVIGAAAVVFNPTSSNEPPTVSVGRRAFRVWHHRRDPDRRYAPAGHPRLAEGEAILCSWDRDRYLHFFSMQSEGGYDVFLLDADGKILEIQPLPRNSEPGITSGVEARRALFLSEGSASRLGIAVGDIVELSDAVREATIDPMPVVRVAGHAVYVETAHQGWERNRGLMYRPRMSADDGMLFIYPREIDKLGFWMKNTIIPLDIAYFGGRRELVNVCPTRAHEKPEIGDTITAPAAGPAQFVLEVNYGWFWKRNLVNEVGKPLQRLVMEVPPEFLSRRADDR